MPKLSFQKETESFPKIIWRQLPKMFYWTNLSFSFNSINSAIKVEHDEVSVGIIAGIWIEALLCLKDAILINYVMFTWKYFINVDMGFIDPSISLLHLVNYLF